MPVNFKEELQSLRIGVSVKIISSMLTFGIQLWTVNKLLTYFIDDF